jgi:hypothetical protein
MAIDDGEGRTGDVMHREVPGRAVEPDRQKFRSDRLRSAIVAASVVPMFDALAIVEATHKWAGTDVRVGTDAELFEAAVALEQARSLVEVASAHVLAELDSRGACDTTFGMRTAPWVASKAGTAVPPVRRRLRVGRALRRHFGVVDDAVVDGSLSFDHAASLADATNERVADVIAGAQPEIIALAQGSTFQQWKFDIAALVEHADADGAAPDDPADTADGTLTTATTLDGRTHLRGELGAAAGLAVRTALDAKTDELFRRLSRDHKLTPDLPVPDRATLRARALVELLQIATGAEPGSGSVPRAEVTLVLHDHEVTDVDGGPVPRAAADVWGCDPAVWAVIVDHMGIPVDAGHTRRLATVAQRRAIAVRDGGCTFPGCDAPINWCDHHHVDDWHLGGPTDLSNLVALCRHHHGVTHRTGWSLTLDHEQIPIWHTPTGLVLRGQRHHRQAPAPASDTSPDG